MTELSDIRVLLVEPNPSAREMVRTILRSTGIRAVREAENGRAALEALGRGPCDAVVTEWTLPEPGGVGLIRAIRREPDEERRRVPVLVLSSDSLRATVLAARDAGAHAFLCKPVSTRLLGQRILDIVNRPRAFVVSGSYVGPDRRFFVAPPAGGRDRRAGSADDGATGRG